MNRTEPKKLDARVVKTYDSLYKTFFELLSENSFDSITVLEICDRTGVHRATFYKHFIDKQDFVNFCLKRKMSELNFNNNNFILDSKAKVFYMDLCKRIIDFICDNKKLFTDLNADSSCAFSEVLTGAVSDYIEKRLNYSASKNGVFLSSVSLLSDFYAGALVSLLKSWSKDWDKYTKEDILKFIVARYNELEYYYHSVKQ